MSEPVILSLEGILLRQGGRAVLDDLSLELHANEVLALVGPSGSGKTSVVRTALGLIRPERGVVRVAGNLATERGKLLVAPEDRHLAVVFQDLALWPHLTVHGNLAFALKARGMAVAQREERIGDMLQRVGLVGLARRHPGELSGGERQRVAIARALVLEPRAMLLDEPLANLDVDLKRELLVLFRELITERRVPTIFVTHDPREAASLGDRIAVIECGRIIQAGSIVELKDTPATHFVESFVSAL